MVRDIVCKNRGTNDDATDIFQDGLLILHRNINNGSFRSESSIKTYIFSICRNLWLKELGKRQKLVASAAEMAIELSQDVNNYLINVEVITLLLSELKEECKSMLTEYYFKKKSMAELMNMFNVGSIQAAKNKKLRCMGYLVRLCKERGITTASHT
jgi:RNA polymerase sigma factor (sigma-70 family)